MSDHWPEENIATLRRLWAEGLSASQIAKVLGGGMSRSAVCGKVWRLGLEKRREQARDPRAIRSKLRNVVARLRKPRVTAPKLIADNFVARTPQKHALSIRWIDHKDFKHCAMMCEGESGALGFVCGKAATHGVYCADCVRLVYQPSQQKIKEAA